MSFSFNARGANKAAALKAVATEMAKVVKAQPIHARDAESVQATAKAYVGLLADEAPDHDVIVGVAGSLEYLPDEAVIASSLSISARFIDKE